MGVSGWGLVQVQQLLGRTKRARTSSDGVTDRFSHCAVGRILYREVGLVPKETTAAFFARGPGEGSPFLTVESIPG